ncbi:fimbrial protein [Enterobacter sp. 118C5]|uniref:fimbrial protein n=1 Tax=Enterobacter TaxID=547 RepID=UPI002A7EBDDD|nr:fimbrial protein [Enterobacter sp. 118C5]
MKKYLLTIAASIAAVTTINAYSADGTIHFTGSISDEACTVDAASQNMTVDLGKISQSTLNGSAGLRAAPTSFVLSLSNCPATLTAANVKFDGTSDSTDSSLLALDSDAGVASGVAVELSDASGNPLDLKTSSMDYPITTGVTNNLQFTARYISTGSTVVAGTANATTEFTMSYK